MKYLGQQFGVVLLASSIGIGWGAWIRGEEADPAGDSTALRAAAAMYEGIRTETLPNGLRIYLKPVPGSPVVTTMVAYKVGSADENLDQTGLSHYLEHLMFKGTEKIMPGDIDRLTFRNGGMNNAYTSEDYTIYHFDFPAGRWEQALEVEADRMRNLRIDEKHEFQQEKGAVISELERNEDEPWDLEQKAVLPLLFSKGPYGHPVIGERAHVRNATAEIIKSHYDKWYHPNNAALVISGGFDPDLTLAKIKKLFGPIPAAKLPERKPELALKRQGPVRKEIDSKFDLPRLLIGYNTVRTGDPDSYTLDVVQALLSTGKSSRFYKTLVEGEEIANSAQASNSTGRYPGWFAIQVELLKGKSRDKAEKLALAELKKLSDQPVSEAELKRVKQGVIANAIYGRESVHELADSIARGVTTNDLDYLKTYLSRIQAVSAGDVQKAAKKYFDPEQRAVVWSVPKAAGKGDKKDAQGKDKNQRSDRRAAAAGGPGFSLKDAQRVVLPNGLTLLLFENRRVPIFFAEAFVRQTRLHEPAGKMGVAALTGALFDEGTPKHTGPQIAEMIENVGGVLSLNSSGGSIKVLSPDQKLGLGLLLECLTQPIFPKEAFERQKQQQLSQIDDAETRPETKGQQLYRGLVFGKHPNGWPGLGRRATVEPLTIADCQAFHRQVFVPNNTILAIAGDFDSKQMIAEVTRLTAGWKSSPVPKLSLPAVEKPEKFAQQIVSMADAAQLHFFMGHVGIRRDNPDYYKLLVMDYILGTGPGFTDRLSSRLRDREGLAYTVSATIASSSAEEPGTFTCYIGTQPENFAKVKGMFLEELNRIRSEKPKLQEVEDAKTYLLGSQLFQYTTNERVADQLIYIERFNLGFGYLDDYRKAVAAVTPEDVQTVAKKYLDPQRMILVAAGAIDANGKPLEKLPSPKNK